MDLLGMDGVFSFIYLLNKTSLSVQLNTFQPIEK